MAFYGRVSFEMNDLIDLEYWHSYYCYKRSTCTWTHSSVQSRTGSLNLRISVQTVKYIIVFYIGLHELIIFRFIKRCHRRLKSAKDCSDYYFCQNRIDQSSYKIFLVIYEIFVFLIRKRWCSMSFSCISGLKPHLFAEI